MESLYYAKALSDTSLWRMPVEGGPATKVLDSLSSHLNVAIVDSGIYFVPATTAPGSSIQFLDFATNKILPVASFEKALNLGEAGGLAVSPDRKWLLYTRVDEGGSNLMIVEKFSSH